MDYKFKDTKILNIHYNYMNVISLFSNFAMKLIYVRRAKRITVIFCLIVVSFSYSQVGEVEGDSIPLQYYFFEGDSIPRSYVDLDPVIVFQPLKFASKEDRYRYYILKRRSEEHTSELQSRENLVCRLLLEKKKKVIVRNMYWI